MAVMVTMDQLGAELRRHRKSRDLSLRDVEGETGISAATLSRVERGSTPDIEVVRKLAAWLGLIVSAVEDATPQVRTDDDLKRTIAVHLRANKKLPEEVARTIADAFDIVMQYELQRAGLKKKPQR